MLHFVRIDNYLPLSGSKPGFHDETVGNNVAMNARRRRFASSPRPMPQALAVRQGAIVGPSAVRVPQHSRRPPRGVAASISSEVYRVLDPDMGRAIAPGIIRDAIQIGGTIYGAAGRD